MRKPKKTYETITFSQIDPMKAYRINASVATMADTIQQAQRNAIAMIEASETLRPFAPSMVETKPGARRNLEGAWEVDVEAVIVADTQAAGKLRELIEHDVSLEPGE